MAFYLHPSGHPWLWAALTAFVVFVAILFQSSNIPLFILLPSLSSRSISIVEIGINGVSYRGLTMNGVDHFQNIFYAEDTSGPNRFAPPVPYTYPAGSFVDATASGAWCPQAAGAAALPFTSPINNVSENCLSLRIARTSGTPASARLPVLVWIHSGRDGFSSSNSRVRTLKYSRRRCARKRVRSALYA